ncbi:MAG: LPXTG cell wall anchor domain-containing protein [Actinomycetaceae bacterium]|nr:LPXTG cell wall anchor domain-containing protein [Actinomycetaceae bacterium]
MRSRKVALVSAPVLALGLLLQAGAPLAVAEELPGNQEQMVAAEQANTEPGSSAEQTPKTWIQKIEAESGEFAGTGKFETPTILGGHITVAGFLDQGEANSVTLFVEAKKETTAELSVHYRAGDPRKLNVRNADAVYDVPVPMIGEGNWTTFKDSAPIKITLNAGVNALKFFAPEGWNGPSIDYITLLRTDAQGAQPEPTSDITVKFEANGAVVKELTKKVGQEITVGELPQLSEEILGEKDLLGWFYGANSQYEAIFPMEMISRDNLASIFPSQDHPSISATDRNHVNAKLAAFKNEWAGQNELVLKAKLGNHTPANPIEKPGYRLIFNDEFNDTELDETKWVKRYLSSWSQDWKQTNNYVEDHGHMTVKIDRETEPWAREFDGQTVVSGFTTGQRNGLHNWNRSNQVRNPEDTQLTHINQYGYYEMRAKGQSGSSRHIAWWLTGFEDVAQESAEIDIFEVLGNNPHVVPSAFHKWNDPDAADNNRAIASHQRSDKDFHNEWHVYGFDWEQGAGSGAYPDRITMYVDGEVAGSKNVNIDYPMIQLISLYEKRMMNNWTGPWEWRPYPNTFEIDYVRVYKKLPEAAPALLENQLQVEKVTAEDLRVTPGQVALRSYDKAHGGPFTEKTLPGTKSYVRVLWNDGVETQEPVVWDAITTADLDLLNAGTSVNKTGVIPTLDNRKVAMRINAGDSTPPSTEETENPSPGQTETSTNTTETSTSPSTEATNQSSTQGETESSTDGTQAPSQSGTQAPGVSESMVETEGTQGQSEESSVSTDTPSPTGNPEVAATKPTTPSKPGKSTLAKTGVEIVALALAAVGLATLGASAVVLRRRRGV